MYKKRKEPPICYQKSWWKVVHMKEVIMQGIVCKQQPTIKRKRVLVPQKLNVIIDGGVFLIKVPCVNCWLIIWCLLDVITKVKQFFTCQGFFSVVLILKNNTQGPWLVHCYFTDLLGSEGGDPIVNETTIREFIWYSKVCCAYFFQS